MMYGLGAATATGATVTASTTTGAAGAATGATPGFTTGLEQWGNPPQALTIAQTLLGNTSAAFSGALLPFTFGVFLPPLALAGLLLFAMSGGKR